MHITQERNDKGQDPGSEGGGNGVKEAQTMCEEAGAVWDRIGS